jgi:crotonobetainyl-CoA:carnitine CoA-transferase CaiB-like acyl-CoA transferase
VEFLGRPGWATGDALDTVAGRRANETMIEERLAAWCADRDRDELFHALQDAGVTAGPVMSSRDAAEDPHLAAGGAWTHLPPTEDYPETDWVSPAYRFSKSDVRIRTAPALFGEHNDYVYRELLGCSEEEVARLAEAGHIRDSYDETVINGA